MNQEAPGTPREMARPPAIERADFSDEIDLSSIWAAVWFFRFRVAAATLLMGALFAGGSYLLRPVFRAEVLLAPTTEQKNPLGSLAAQLGGFTELAGVRLGASSGRAEAVATLKSRALTEQFIKDRNLLPVLFESGWNNETGKWKSSDPDNVPTFWDAYWKFDRNIRRIQEDRKTGLVTLSVEWYDREVAAEWANELVRRANEKLQLQAISEGKKTISYLEQQLERANAIEVKQALYSLIEVETKQIAVAHAREEFAFKVIDPAVAPRRKVKPDRVALTLMGLVFGLGLATIWAVRRFPVSSARTGGTA